MIYSKLFALLSLASFAFALPKDGDSRKNYLKVTKYYAYEPYGKNDTNQYKVSFKVEDPYDSTYAFCETTWPYSIAKRDHGSDDKGDDDKGGYPHEWVSKCDDISYSFYFENYKYIGDYRLNVRHDSEKNNALKYARGKVEDKTVKCVHYLPGYSICTLKDNVDLLLEVHD